MPEGKLCAAVTATIWDSLKYHFDGYSYDQEGSPDTDCVADLKNPVQGNKEASLYFSICWTIGNTG